jgi:hypothetical protein
MTVFVKIQNCTPEKGKFRPGTVAHAWNSSYLGGKDRRIIV